MQLSALPQDALTRTKPHRDDRPVASVARRADTSSPTQIRSFRRVRACGRRLAGFTAMSSLLASSRAPRCLPASPPSLLAPTLTLTLPTFIAHCNLPSLPPSSLHLLLLLPPSLLPSTVRPSMQARRQRAAERRGWVEIDSSAKSAPNDAAGVVLDEDLDVILFYKYTPVCVPATMLWLEPKARSLSLTGRVLLSDEGVNGSLAGAPASVSQFCAEMEACSLADFTNIDWKHSIAVAGGPPPFSKLVVRRSLEVTASGRKMAACSPQDQGGVHLTPDQFHVAVEALQQRRDNVVQLSSPAHPVPEGWVPPSALTPQNTVLIDVRNAYEVGVGRFEGAFNPELRSFAQLSAWADENKAAFQDKNVLMYCTGGVRCEKASAYIKKIGASRVAQLKGGIHRYFEAYPDGGLFKGSNFIFDDRMLQRPEEPAESSATDATPEPLGRCNYCAAPSEAVGSDLLCRVCRHFVIVCSDCAQLKRMQAAAVPQAPAAAASCGGIEEEEQEEDKEEKCLDSAPGDAHVSFSNSSPFLCGEHRLLSPDENEWRGMLALVPTPLLRAQRASLAASLDHAVRKGGRRLRDRKRALQLKLFRADSVLGERATTSDSSATVNDDEADPNVAGSAAVGSETKPQAILALTPYYSLLNPALSPWGQVLLV